MRWATIVVLWLWPGFAAGAEMGALLRAGDWPAASAAAAAADPVAKTLVTYLRLLTREAASAGEIDAFLTDHPDWPQRALLGQRYGEALTTERDDDDARALCLRRPPHTPGALLRCAGLGGGDADARLAWIGGITDPATEAAFMRRWGNAIGGQTQLLRFERLAWTEKPAPGGALAREAVRLDPAARPMAEARLALRRDDPAGSALFATLPPLTQAEPGLMLDLARWYRRADRDADAVRVWTERGAAAEAAAPPERQRLFWDERNLLARHLLRLRQDATAYAIVRLPTAAAASQADAAFLAGWIALRRLGQAEIAAASFRALTASRSAVSQARAHYWLARALSGAEAEAEFRAAAAWPTTYYGQLAALALDGPAGLRTRLQAIVDPAWNEAQALDLAGSELARAATLLVAWGEPRRAKPFLERLEERGGDPAARAVVARFADALGLPEAAVAAARRAGRDGVMLPEAGWPEAAEPPPGPVERAVVLGLVRQESSFDAQAGSPAGAQGLMQLMPGTAADVARKIGAQAAPLSDPALNLRLGTAYLAGLLDRFGALPPALAGYNAGPGRAREWIAATGDPATGAIDPIDWVELIPFTETRDYVQRVVENVVIYRIRAGASLPHPVLRWAAGGT